MTLLLVKLGLGQVQLKLGDLKSALANFEKVLEVYPDNCEALKVSQCKLALQLQLDVFFVFLHLF